MLYWNVSCFGHNYKSESVSLPGNAPDKKLLNYQTRSVNTMAADATPVHNIRGHMK